MQWAKAAACSSSSHHLSLSPCLTMLKIEPIQPQLVLYIIFWENQHHVGLQKKKLCISVCEKNPYGLIMQQREIYHKIQLALMFIIYFTSPIPILLSQQAEMEVIITSKIKAKCDESRKKFNNLLSHLPIMLY